MLLIGLVKFVTMKFIKQKKWRKGPEWEKKNNLILKNMFLKNK